MIKLTPDEVALLERVEGYCLRGLTQPQMAAEEGQHLSRFRAALLRLGFEIGSRTERRLLRTKTELTLEDLRRRGEIAVENGAHP